MLWLVVITGLAALASGCLYARERRKRIAAEAHVEGCRLAARVAIRDRDAAIMPTATSGPSTPGRPAGTRRTPGGSWRSRGSISR
jgi:hypothetical protein